MKQIDNRDLFSLEETERRMEEMVRRCVGMAPTFDFETGQNLGEPKLSAEELKERGYPCEPWWKRRDL